MRSLARKTLLVCGTGYLLLTLPLVLLLLRSEYFRDITAAEVARKLSHVWPMEGVFCGDSITAAANDWSSGLGFRPFSTLNLALPGLFVHQVQEQVRRALLLRTRRIIVMAGTNDLGDGRRTDDAILADWDAILRLGLPNAPPRRFVVSIPLQRDPLLDARIADLNRRLRDAAHRSGWVFVDLNARFKAAQIPRSELFPDGRHFSALAYRLWTEELARALDLAK